MGFLGFLGSMFFGVIIIGVLVILGIVSFFVSGWYRLKNNSRNNRGTTSGYSTGSSSNRYAYSRNAGSRSRRGYYSGPTARRTYSSRGTGSQSSQNTQSASGSASAASASQAQNDVVEIPILEVTDIDDKC